MSEIKAKTKQVKRMPQAAFGTPQSGGEASGRPTSSLVELNGKETGQSLEVDKRRRRYIRIDDSDQWEKIDRIMTLPEYRKSFNKVINAALFYGLEELEKSLFEEIETVDEGTSGKYVRRIDGINEEYFMRILGRIEEVLLNVTLNKSMLCSLYHAKGLDLNGKPMSGRIYESGGYADTPDYLSAYEDRVLRRIRK